MSEENKITELTDKQIEKVAGGSNSEIDAEVNRLLDRLKILFKLLEEIKDENEKDKVNKEIALIKDRLADLQLKLLLNDFNMPIEL